MAVCSMLRLPVSDGNAVCLETSCCGCLLHATSACCMWLLLAAQTAIYATVSFHMLFLSAAPDTVAIRTPCTRSISLVLYETHSYVKHAARHPCMSCLQGSVKLVLVSMA